MKPKIGKIVYIVDKYWYSITRDIVGYLGKDSFIVEGYRFRDDNAEQYYESFDEKWFYSFEKAKKCLKDKFEKTGWDRETKFSFKKYGDNYWQINYE